MRWLFVYTLALACYSVSLAQSGFELPRWAIDSGGVSFIQSGEFSLGATIGQYGAGVLTSGDLTLFVGFWFPVPGCVPHNGDVNEDGCVNIVDLLSILLSLGATGNVGRADVDCDGSVNVSDLLVTLLNFSGGC